MKVPLLGLATIAENIILLRQVEIASELKRAIAVMKTRESAHDNKVRELTITDRGMAVGEPFRLQQAVLRGGTLANKAPDGASRAMQKLPVSDDRVLVRRDLPDERRILTRHCVHGLHAGDEVVFLL